MVLASNKASQLDLALIESANPNWNIQGIVHPGFSKTVLSLMLSVSINFYGAQQQA